MSASRDGGGRFDRMGNHEKHESFGFGPRNTRNTRKNGSEFRVIGVFRGLIWVRLGRWVAGVREWGEERTKFSARRLGIGWRNGFASFRAFFLPNVRPPRAFALSPTVFLFEQREGGKARSSRRGRRVEIAQQGFDLPLLGLEPEPVAYPQSCDSEQKADRKDQSHAPGLIGRGFAAGIELSNGQPLRLRVTPARNGG